MSKKIKYLLIVSSLVILVSFSVTFAYFYIQDKKVVESPIGLVKVNPHIYHEYENEIYEAIFYKKNVYHLNVSNMSEFNHINNLRVDFIIESNVDTYIRVKYYDVLTLLYEDADGNKNEIYTVSEDVNYSIDDNWFYNVEDEYFYYKDKVNQEVGKINFIKKGLQYEQKSPLYLIQFSLKMEAVQAYRGPKENWGLDKMPWEV